MKKMHTSAQALLMSFLTTILAFFHFGVDFCCRIWNGMQMAMKMTALCQLKQGTQIAMLSDGSESQNWCLRPGAFVRKMYASLQGRYIEHIIAHNFSERLLLRPIRRKDLTQSQENWAKRDGSKPQNVKSKFYTAPLTVPVPKKKQSQSSKKAKMSITAVLTSHIKCLRLPERYDLSNNLNQMFAICKTILSSEMFSNGTF